MLHLTPEDDFDAEDDDLPWYVIAVGLVLWLLLDRRVQVLLAGVAVVAGMLLLAGCKIY